MIQPVYINELMSRECKLDSRNFFRYRPNKLIHSKKSAACCAASHKKHNELYRFLTSGERNQTGCLI
jgi:hypothetical protein